MSILYLICGMVFASANRLVPGHCTTLHVQTYQLLFYRSSTSIHSTVRTGMCFWCSVCCISCSSAAAYLIYHFLHLLHRRSHECWNKVAYRSEGCLVCNRTMHEHDSHRTCSNATILFSTVCCNFSTASLVSRSLPTQIRCSWVG
jgi:hypothetical protein